MEAVLGLEASKGTGEEELLRGGEGPRDLRTNAEARERTWWKTRSAVIVLERDLWAVGDGRGERLSPLGEARPASWSSESGWG